MLNYILSLAVTGLIVGALARLVLPGREAIGILGTILAGIAGSFVGGIAGRFLFGSVNPWAALALAVGGAILFILPYRVMLVPPVVVDDGYRRRSFFGRRRSIY